ncbi:MAG: hypothetical protein IJM19_09620, partial [Ruminococcus sp.]|nr:hypothetical protein [Ruminococcus sp.]
ILNRQAEITKINKISAINNIKFIKQKRTVLTVQFKMGGAALWCLTRSFKNQRFFHSLCQGAALSPKPPSVHFQNRAQIFLS